MYNNNYQIVVTETKTAKTYTYYFETIEQAERAKKAIEQGGNKAKLKEIKRG